MGTTVLGASVIEKGLDQRVLFESLVIIRSPVCSKTLDVLKIRFHKECSA